MTLERTRNSDKETSFPSLPLSLYFFLSPRSHLGRAIPTLERKTEGGEEDGGEEGEAGKAEAWEEGKRLARTMSE